MSRSIVDIDSIQSLLLYKCSFVLYFFVSRISMTSENGRGTLTIRDVKEADQGAYTCEAINAKGLVFGIPDGVLTLTSNPNPGTNTSLLLWVHCQKCYSFYIQLIINCSYNKSVN